MLHYLVRGVAQFVVQLSLLCPKYVFERLMSGAEYPHRLTCCAHLRHAYGFIGDAALKMRVEEHA